MASLMSHFDNVHVICLLAVQCLIFRNELIEFGSENPTDSWSAWRMMLLHGLLPIIVLRAASAQYKLAMFVKSFPILVCRRLLSLSSRLVTWHSHSRCLRSCTQLFTREINHWSIGRHRLNHKEKHMCQQRTFVAIRYTTSSSSSAFSYWGPIGKCHRGDQVVTLPIMSRNPMTS